MSRATPALPLAEWYVISLRPLGMHASIRRAASKQGARTFALSTLAIERLSASDAVARALACAIVIVTSPVAARLAFDGHAHQPRRGQQWFAVGPGTAATLRRSGVTDVVIPQQGADADALLALPALTRLDGQHVGLVTAPGGRGQIAKVLASRGARIQLAEVYRRVPRRPAPHRLRDLAALPEKTALLVSSGEALAALWRTLPDADRKRLLARPCVVSSERLAGQARALGFRTPWLAGSALPSSLVATLVERAGARRFR